MDDLQLDSATTDRSETARHMAEQVCEGFKCHDSRDREGAIEAFSDVDALQFQHVDAGTARQASVAYVDALWEKDAVERRCMVDGELDREALAAADWGPVEDMFGRRASILGVDSRYATKSTLGWRNHKTGGDYWTPLMAAQVHELRVAMQDPEYPHKPRYGQSGYGPEAARYVLAVDLHDMHTEGHWREACETMVPYYARILDAHESAADG